MKEPYSQKGYTDAGKPTTSRQQKDEQLRDAGLLNNDALMRFENHEGGKGFDVGGFLKRKNYGDRF